MKKNKRCLLCGDKISVEKQRRHAKYCSSVCSRKVHDVSLRYAEGMNSGTVGAIGELTVCADLLKKGYEVFRSVASTCSCDVLAMKNGKVLRIEITRGVVKKETNCVYYARHNPDNYDVIAVWFKNGTISYIGDEVIS